MATETSEPRPSDKWIPWYFFGFFVLLTFVLVPMCLIAVKTYSGVVTEHAYEKGLAYNKAIDAKEKMEALHWQGDLKVGAWQKGHVPVDFTLRDAAGKPIKGADVEIWFARPTQAKLDQKAKMTMQADGRYLVDMLLPEDGLWDVRISAKVDGQVFQLSKRVILQ